MKILAIAMQCIVDKIQFIRITLDVENKEKMQPAREERADVEEKARGNYCR